MPEDRIDASIIVPCRNEAAHIEAFLKSLLAQECADVIREVIISDGLSDDGTRELLAAWSRRYPWIRVIDNECRTVSCGLNAAIKAAVGHIVIRMDVHTLYASDYVKCCCAVLDETGAGNVGGAARTSASSLLGRAIAGAYHSRFSTGGARFHDDSYEGPVDTVPYGCWRKETLQRIGMFDEALVRNQDDELNLRLLRMGGIVWQSRRIRSWYRPRASLLALFKQFYQYGFWKVRVISKHGVPGSWRHLIPAAAMLSGVLLPAMSFAALVAGGSWAPPLAALIVLATLYLCGLCVASISTAARRGWELLPLLPLVFMTYHASYGAGFLSGLAFWHGKRSGRQGVPRVFTQLTR